MRPSSRSVGDKFTYLTLIEKLEIQDNFGNFLWKCQCLCGNTKICTVETAKKTSCGCLRSSCHEKTNLVGEKRGRLLIVERLELVGRYRSYLCKCDCGVEKIMSSKSLQSTRSCGCLAREYGVEKLEEGLASFNSLYCSYRINSQTRRGMPFEISKEFFRSITKMPCFYCGKMPSQIYCRKGSNGGYTYNGIDRINNDIGYLESNCIPCCKICNRMRMELKQNDFLDHIQKIVTHLFDK